jgi:heat shock protein HslJ
MMHRVRRTHFSLLVLGGVAAASVLGACGDDPDPVEPAALEGIWSDADVEGYELAGTLTMSFEDGRVGVQGGCNNLMGPYELDGDQLTAGPLASTMMACPDPLMAQDEWIAELLSDGIGVEVDGTTLTLSSGEVTITLRGTT